MDGEISPESVLEALEGPDPPTIVDVRGPDQYRRAHIRNSLNLPFPALPDRVAELAGAEHVVTVCPHGEASVQAARLVAAYEGCRDATVQSMAGGLEAWPGDLERAEGDDGGGPAPF